ncbi:MAG: lamin tail domain-containing protein, partial [Deltaproteobacteria bacterium]|nr:lamin tail domain-containing protein [Deltaproteobacteria bacterium]
MSCRSFAPIAPARSLLRLRATVVLTLLLGCNPSSKSSDETDVSGDSGDDTGEDVEDVEEVPSASNPWVRDERAAPGSITFNEIYYHPSSDDQPEWLELYNPMALDMDLSGWSLEGGVRVTFPEGTVVAAGGYLVVAADPAALPGALGPFEGRLNNDGERVNLYNNSGRLIDTVAYGDDDPWPVAADGSGLSLAKIRPDTMSDRAEGWSASATLGGTPGQSNLLDPLQSTTTLSLVPLEATWTYDLSGEEPAPGWTSLDFDDSGWDSGQAIFYAGAAEEDAVATAWVTADNYYGLYLGRADGTELRLVGEDPDGDWTTVEGFEIEVTPEDHLYLAAWESPDDYGGPQMTIAEVELPDDVVGTDLSTFEWVLGPSGDSPGPAPGDPPPTVTELARLIDDTNAAASWAPPAVDADRSSDPWGWAVSGLFSDAARYVWGDTFSDTSATNIQNTYALFRSNEPLLGARGTTELGTIPTTVTFRTKFVFDAEPSSAKLFAECVIDDGAVLYLNGVEVLRENLPSGALSADTLATTPITGTARVSAALPADALLRGENVLAVEVHQANEPDTDLSFGCALTARVSAQAAAPTIVLNEIAPATDAPFWVELLTVSASAQDTSGLVLVTSDGEEWALPARALAPGALLALDDVDLSVEAGDVLFLYSANRDTLLDAVRVQSGPRARAEQGGPWRTPSEATPGEPNLIELTDDVVISEIQYHHAPLSREGEPVSAQPEEWIELYNRGTTEVDLSGWQLVDAVAYTFPSDTVLAPGAALVVANDADALRAKHGDITVLGDFSGRLDNSGDRILLLDGRGNPADEVRYFDGGRWPEESDGGGSSLELRDVWADNNAPGSWAASDELPRSEWVTYSFRGEAEPSAVGPDGTWEELVLGLLDQGTLLIDDLSVIQDPDGSAVELLSNGGFDDESARWRLLGNHRHSEIVPDPDDPGDSVLRLVATGPTGHMHNHAETTLLQPIGNQEYELSFRARWVSGSNQLHSRLYFNRLPRTTLVEQPTLSGTPGAPNSTAVDNLGPTLTDLSADVAVPAAGEPVTLSVTVNDPDGVAKVTLWSSVNGAAFVGQAMTNTSAGQWVGALDGQAAGSLVQLYVEAEDDRGATAALPAAGPDSRALLRFDDGSAATNGLHNLRILMTEADSDWLHDDVNLMSDDLIGATVIYNESQVFFDVGVRAKGSQRGRPEQPRLGYGVHFTREEPFRGSRLSVLIDRSEGVGYGQREVLMNLVMTHAGSVSGEYNDLVHAMTPLSEHTGPAELQLDRFTDLVLDAQFADGASGRLFEYELIYYPYTTDDGTAEGLKMPQPDSVIGTSITDLGDDKEDYRWSFLIKNNEREDDYDGIISLGKTFSRSGAAFLAEVEGVIDVDQWLRAFAFATLSGAVDSYGGDGSQHNAVFYVRPEDQRVLYFPHDLDYYGGYSGSVVGNSDLQRLLQDPAHRRSYYGHLQDIVGRAYNPDYLAPWCAQLSALLPAQDFQSHCQFVADRASWVMNDSSRSVLALYPPVDFGITTGGGADLVVSTTEVTLEGVAWIDVREITLDGATSPLDLTWVTDQTWQATVPLNDGPNTLSLVATDLGGAVVGSDSIVV